MAMQAFLCLLLMAGWPQEERRPSAAGSADSEQRPFRISGTVVDAMGGQPLAGALVTISLQRVRGSSQTTTTGEDGQFMFENLTPGQYALYARRKGYVDQAYKQHEQFSTAIIVGAGLNSENLRFELRPGASISGQVVDEMNDPVRNAQVMLFQRGLALGQTSTWQENRAGTNDLGRYHFGHLAPGMYFVAVSAQPWYAQRVMHQRVEQFDASGGRTYQEITIGEPELDLVYPVTFFPNAVDISGAGAITVQAGSAEVADFQLQPVRALHITVRTSAPADAGTASGPDEVREGENVFAEVTQPLGPGVQVGVQANTQQVAPGLLEISGLPPGRFNLQLESNRNGEMKSHSQTVQIAGDTEVTATEGNASGTISGVARLEDGSAFTRELTMVFRARAGGEQFPMQLTQGGQFGSETQSLPPGTYDVLVSQPPNVAVKRMTATGAKVNGRSLEIGGGQDVKLKVVLSEGTGQITGIALKEGKAMDGVMIVLVPEVPEHNLVLFRRDQSDSDGSFTLSGVHAGKYTVVAIGNGWDLGWFEPGVIQKYLAGGEPVQVSANAKIEVKVKVQQP